MKRKKQMPRYYSRNIVQHAQKKFLQRKALESNQKKQRILLADELEAVKKD